MRVTDNVLYDTKRSAISEDRPSIHTTAIDRRSRCPRAPFLHHFFTFFVFFRSYGFLFLLFCGDQFNGLLWPFW